MVAVTNDLKLGDLQQQKFVLSQVWMPEVWNPSMLPPRTLVGGGNPFVLFSSLWWPLALPSSWLCRLSIASIFTPVSPLRVCLLRKFLLLYLLLLSITCSAVKNLPAKQETWILSLGQRGGNSNPFQCSCLENSMGRGAWQAIVYGVSKESDMT